MKKSKRVLLMLYKLWFLSKQFPSIFGLQDVVLGYVMNFSVQDGEFLRILHSVNHWVTISLN